MAFYTDLRAVFDVLGDRILDFHWLLTDVDCIHTPAELPPDGDPLLCSGGALRDILRRQSHPPQFVWAVLTGLDPDLQIDLSVVRNLPFANGNAALWRGKPRIQCPGARVEIVCWDSSATLLTTGDQDLVTRFCSGFPEAVDTATLRHKLRRTYEAFRRWAQRPA